MGTGDSTGFVRQRRNLILVSLVLLFAQLHSVTFLKFSLFGTDLGIEKPVNPELYIWIAFFYLLWRYYVYFHDEGEKGFVAKHRSRLTKLVEKIALQKLETDPDCSKILNGYLREVNAKEWKLEHSSYGYDTPSRWRWTLNLTISGYIDNRRIPLHAPIPVLVAGIQFFQAKIRAWIYVLFRTTTFSEYIVPFVIAVVPLVVGLRRLVKYVFFT